MRVGIIALQHESNTFLPVPTTLEAYRRDALLTGEAIREAYGSSHHEVGGFFHGLREADLTAVPLLLALATPAGPLSADTVETLIRLMFEQLDAAGPLDGLLVAPHGAAVAEGQRDFDGHWLTLLRQRLGQRIPIVCTLDLHANVSGAMVAACNATLAYRTNPHLDQHETGLRAARLMAQMLRGQVRPVQVLVSPPLAVSIDRQETAAPPCDALYAFADEVRHRPGVLDVSIQMGFPYADVEEMGTTVIAIADGDESLARAAAQDLADYLIAHRHDFACGLAEVDEAVREAARSAERVCLLDVGDNVGGGSPGDGTVLAHALHKQGVDRSFVCLCDSEAQQAARSAGVGATLTLSMGGKTDDLHGQPLTAPVTVVSLHDGHYSESRPRHGGRTRYNMGPTAVVRTPRGLTLLLHSQRVPPFSLAQLTSCGLDPASFHVLAAKGVNAPIAAYREVCDKFIRVNTPGVTCADMTRLTFHRRRKPLFPFEEVA
ncbi:MAG TPA: M81 family metallopeptidase [Phycisphaeraceae bacterium]